MGKNPAFQFYPAEWKGSRWIRHNYTTNPNDWLIKKIPGCYVIYGDNDLLYIGQSANVYKRITNHQIRFGYGASIITPWGNYRDVHIKVHYSLKMGDWLMREFRLINRIKPKFNKEVISV